MYSSVPCIRRTLDRPNLAAPLHSPIAFSSWMDLPIQVDHTYRYWWSGRESLSVSWWDSMSGSVCRFLFRPEKFNVTLKQNWSSMGLQQTPKTFSGGACVSLGISFSFWLSELPQMVQPSILNPSMSTSLSMFCVMLSALFLSPTLSMMSSMQVLSLMTLASWGYFSCAISTVFLNATMATVPEGPSPNETLYVT